ncbi:MAG: SEC-C domain-containing protein [Bdellovibrionota bacterium]
MPTLGRNDRCPCGSGRKYKRCCLQKDNPTVSTDLPWKQIRAARESLNIQMMDYSIGIYDKGALQRAWDDWCCEVDESLVMQGGEFVTFMSWFLVNWVDQDKKKKIPLPPLSWRFRTERENKLSPIEKDYLNFIIDEPFSFFEILEPKPGNGYLLKDILTGREIYVYEKSGSQGVEAGAILFGRLAMVDDVAIFDASSDILFPAQWKNTILELRQEIRRICKVKKDQMPSVDQLVGFTPMIRSLYRDFRHAAQNPTPPQLVNTDGEPLSFNKVIFDIEDANTVFEKLHALDFNDTKEELLEDADKNTSGKILKIEFPWLKKGNKQPKGMGNTVLGHITIEESRMTVDTNSLERVDAIKGIIVKRCGKSVRHKTTLIEPFEAKMKELQKKQSPRHEEASAMNQQELMNMPEVKAQLQAMQRKHMESWITEKIPALGGKTPV